MSFFVEEILSSINYFCIHKQDKSTPKEECRRASQYRMTRVLCRQNAFDEQLKKRTADNWRIEENKVEEHLGKTTKYKLK